MHTYICISIVLLPLADILKETKHAEKIYYYTYTFIMLSNILKHLDTFNMNNILIFVVLQCLHRISINK